MTLDDILTSLTHKLDWRGPGGKPMGIITLPREQAEVICAWIEELLVERKRMQDEQGQQRPE